MYTVMLRPSGDTTGAADTTAIQAAINVVMASTGGVGRCLEFEEGNYYINSKITATWGATSASQGPLEIKGSGQTIITQVTDNTGMFEFVVPNNGLPGFFSFGNLTLTYQNPQAYGSTSSVCLGIRSINGNPAGSETAFQMYFDRLRCLNCNRGIANVQPLGQFAIWGIHITNFVTSYRSGAGIWIVSPTAVGQPNINIDHWLDANSDGACTDPAMRIDACDNLVIKNCEFLKVTNNLPLIWLSTCPAFVIEGCKGEACTYSAVMGTPNNYVNFFQNSYGVVNSFRINGTNLGVNVGVMYPFPPVMFKVTGTMALGGAVTLAGININVTAGGMAGTPALLSIVSCSMKVHFLSPPGVDLLSTNTLVRLYNSAGDSGTSPNVTFASPPGGEISADMGNTSLTFAPLSVSPSSAGTPMTLVYNTALTGAVTVTLPTSVGTAAADNLADGMECHVVRTAAATGASSLTVGSKTLTVGQWVRMKYKRQWPSTPAWVEVAFGSL